MKREYYEEEMMLKEAITSQKTDQEIGMPDVEAELQRVKLMAKKRKMTFVGWQRIAAMSALVLSISGLSWAIYYQQNLTSSVTPEPQTVQTEKVTSTVKQVEETTEMKVSEDLSLSYDKASLDQIIVDLTAFYQLEKPIFENKEAAHACKMHITIDKNATIQDAVNLLNHFGSLHIELVENRLVVK